MVYTIRSWRGVGGMQYVQLRVVRLRDAQGTVALLLLPVCNSLFDPSLPYTDCASLSCAYFVAVGSTFYLCLHHSLSPCTSKCTDQPCAPLNADDAAGTAGELRVLPRHRRSLQRKGVGGAWKLQGRSLRNSEDGGQNTNPEPRAWHRTASRSIHTCRGHARMAILFFDAAVRAAACGSGLSPSDAWRAGQSQVYGAERRGSREESGWDRG